MQQIQWEGRGGHVGEVAEKMKRFENEVLILEEYDEKA